MPLVLLENTDRRRVVFATEQIIDIKSGTGSCVEIKLTGGITHYIRGSWYDIKNQLIQASRGDYTLCTS